jgi:hypothetical protein
MTFTEMIAIVRSTLKEPTASFWTDAELLKLANLGIKDLWRGITNLDKDHFYTVDSSNVTLENGDITLTGVPATVARVLLIEPQSLTSYPTMTFEPRGYGHPDMIRARALAAAAPADGDARFFAVVGAGAPVGAPTIYCAPKVNAQLALSLVYVPSLADNVTGDENPIPGEADLAVIAWTVAYALAKESATHQPDKFWLDVYNTEKQICVEMVQERQSVFGHKRAQEIAVPVGDG